MLIKDLIENKAIIDKYTSLFNYANENRLEIYTKFKDYINTEFLSNSFINDTIDKLSINNIKTIFKDDIYDRFMIYLNIFVNFNINEILSPKDIDMFKYKTLKFYYASRFSSLIEYFLFSNEDINSGNNTINHETINQLHDINNVNLLFFICASYALLDTYIDSNNFAIHDKQDKELEIQHISRIFNQYFKCLLSDLDFNLSSNQESSVESVPIIRALKSLLEYANLNCNTNANNDIDDNKINKLVIETIMYCFNLEIECYYTQNNSYQSNNDLVSMMVKKGMSSLVLSFITKDTDSINDNKNDNSNTNNNITTTNTTKNYLKQFINDTQIDIDFK